MIVADKSTHILLLSIVKVQSTSLYMKMCSLDLHNFRIIGTLWYISIKNNSGLIGEYILILGGEAASILIMRCS